MFRNSIRFLHTPVAILLAVTAILISPNLLMAAKQIDPATVKLPDMTPDLNLGKMNYDVKCASCHGMNTAGTDKGPTFLHRVYHPGHHGDAAFYTAPKKGVRAHHWPFGDMPPVAGITDAQTEKIIIYIRALQKTNGVF